MKTEKVQAVGKTTTVTTEKGVMSNTQVNNEKENEWHYLMSWYDVFKAKGKLYLCGKGGCYYGGIECNKTDNVKEVAENIKAGIDAGTIKAEKRPFRTMKNVGVLFYKKED